jgi:hypothetical protein
MNFGYTLHQAERPKTPAERRAENQRLGELAATLTRPGTGHADTAKHAKHGRRGGRGKPVRRATPAASPAAPFTL